MKTRIPASLALALVAGTASAQTAETATFTGLGNVQGLPGNNANGCYLSDRGVISGDGTLAFGLSFVPGQYGAGAVAGAPFSVAAGGASPALVGPSSAGLYPPVAVSLDGSLAAGNNWLLNNGVLTDLTPTLEADIFSLKTVTDAALDQGRLVGTQLDLFRGGEPTEVFIWDVLTGSPTILPTPNLGQIGISLFAEISDDGSTIGGAITWPEFESSPAVWTDAGGFQLLGDLNPADRAGGVADLSADGSIVVGFSRATDQGVAGFRWTESGGIQALSDEFEALIFSPARAVTADGSTIVGQYLTPNLTVEPYIWTEDQGLRNLRTVLVNEFGLGSQLAGWTLIDVYDISFAGETIIGYGTNPQGCGELFTVTFGASSSCAADVNGNGAVEPGDFGAWVSAYNAGDAAADQNGDNEVTPSDFGAFIANFNAGC